MVVLAGLATSTPYSWLPVNVPPLMITLDPAFPLIKTPEPSLPVRPSPPLSVPFALAVTLLRVTTLALLIVIPSPSLFCAITLVRVTMGALNVAPSYVLLPLCLDSWKVVLLMLIDPVPVVAEKPLL